MIQLETLLNPDELAAWRNLIEEAGSAGAQAVRWHSASSGVLVVGIVSKGELLTWFASPAHDAIEAATAQAVILSGITQASATFKELIAGPAAIAADAIKKASAKHH